MMGYYELENELKRMSLHAAHLRDLLRARDRGSFRKVLSECKELIPYNRDIYERLVHSAYVCEDNYYQTRNIIYYDRLIDELEYCYGVVFKIIIERLKRYEQQ